MAVQVKKLAPKKRTVEVPIAESSETVSLTYVPAMLTPKNVRKLVDPEAPDGEVLGLLGEIVLEIDVEIEKGVLLDPKNAEHWNDIPAEFMAAVLQSMLEGAQVGKGRSGDSGATS